jgi:uncharacterized membrane protein
MKTRVLVQGFGLLILAVNAQAADRPYDYSQLDYPGAARTVASGIGADGTVVGWYDAVGLTHGFAWERGAFRTVDYPGAILTQVRGIGPNGELVGTYRRPGEAAVNRHGFLLTRDDDFLPIDYPGHTSTVAQRILADGTILGCLHDWDSMVTMRGIVISADGATFLDVFSSMNNGATPDRSLIAGWYVDMDSGKTRGYVLDNGVFTPFDVPGSRFTDAWDVSPDGAIVGSYADTSGRRHGYVLEDGGFVTIDFTAATYTDVLGINASGQIVGRFVDANGRTHAYVARPLSLR